MFFSVLVSFFFSPLFGEVGGGKVGRGECVLLGSRSDGECPR